MTDRPPEPPAAAYVDLVDALEAVHYDHPDCPRGAAEVACAFVGADHRTVVAWTARPTCLRDEMRARQVVRSAAVLAVWQAGPLDLRPHWEPPSR